jgi:hypothetical protein
MKRHTNTASSDARGSRRSLVLGCAIALAFSACTKGGDKLASDKSKDPASDAKSGAIVMCTLMSKEAVNSAIGSAYTIAEASEGQSTSSCHYHTETDPTGLSLDMQWITPSEYSDPAEHAALQKAGLGGAKLGGKLETGMVGSGPEGAMHIHSGPVEGVGDEATQTMMLLTARKGDYTLMVQIIPDIMKLMTDSTAGPRVLENEKTLARAVLSKV